MLGPVRPLCGTIFHVGRDFVALISLAMRSRAQLAAENVFLRKQLALYMPFRPPRGRRGIQAWSTFVRNHAQSVLASDFFAVVTASFRLIYVFVVPDSNTANPALECNSASDGRLDRAAVPNARTAGPATSLRDPSRQHLFGERGSNRGDDGPDCSSDAGSRTAGERILRTLGGYDSLQDLHRVRPQADGEVTIRDRSHSHRQHERNANPYRGWPSEFLPGIRPYRNLPRESARLQRAR